MVAEVQLFQAQDRGKNTDADDAVTFSVWDFGGQRVFYALHHAFLTRHGVYLVVFRMPNLLDPAREEECARYLRGWLRCIALHARGAPVALVGTHKDMLAPGTETSGTRAIHGKLETIMKDCNAYLDLRMLTQNRADQLNFFPVDNRTGDADPTVRALREMVDRAVHEDPLKYIELRLPVTWLRVHDKLRVLARTRPTMRIEDVERLARTKCGVPPRDLQLLLRLLHQLGVLLYYDETELRRTVFLDPQWIVDRFSRVIRSWTGSSRHPHPRQAQLRGHDLRHDFKTFARIAVATRPLLETMIQDDDASDRSADVVIPLMTKFALLCRYGDGSREEKYLVPSVLSRSTRYRSSRRRRTARASRSRASFPTASGSGSSAGASTTPPCGATRGAPGTVGRRRVHEHRRSGAPARPAPRARCVDVRCGQGEDIAWFCATIFDMAVDVGTSSSARRGRHSLVAARRQGGRRISRGAGRQGGGHDRAGRGPRAVVPAMLEMWFGKDPAPAPPAPSSADVTPVVYTRDSWKPFQVPGGLTYHVYLAHSSPSFAETVRNVLGRRGIFSWYEQTQDWAQRLEACAAVVVVVTAGSLRSSSWRRRSPRLWSWASRW